MNIIIWDCYKIFKFHLFKIHIMMMEAAPTTTKTITQNDETNESIRFVYKIFMSLNKLMHTSLLEEYWCFVMLAQFI